MGNANESQKRKSNTPPPSGSLTLSLEKTHYEPGQRISGLVSLDIASPFPIASLTVELLGKETTEHQSLSKKGVLIEENCFFNQSNSFPAPDGTPYFPAGRFVVPFTFILSQDLPPSFSHACQDKHASISANTSYVVLASLVCSNSKYQIRADRAFAVLNTSPPAETQNEASTSHLIAVKAHKKWPKSVKLQLRLLNSRIVKGEDTQIGACLDTSASGQNLKEVKVELIQEVSVRGDNARKALAIRACNKNSPANSKSDCIKTNSSKTRKKFSGKCAHVVWSNLLSNDLAYGHVFSERNGFNFFIPASSIVNNSSSFHCKNITNNYLLRLSFGIENLKKAGDLAHVYSLEMPVQLVDRRAVVGPKVTRSDSPRRQTLPAERTRGQSTVATPRNDGTPANRRFPSNREIPNDVRYAPPVSRQTLPTLNRPANHYAVAQNNSDNIQSTIPFYKVNLDSVNRLPPNQHRLPEVIPYPELSPSQAF